MKDEIVLVKTKIIEDEIRNNDCVDCMLNNPKVHGCADNCQRGYNYQIKKVGK